MYRQIYVHKLLTAALFIIATTWRKANCPSASECIYKRGSRGHSSAMTRKEHDACHNTNDTQKHYTEEAR